ncbi:hypothetical protein ABDX87_20080 [Pseudomonas abietaniphila]|uniref:hypothetical protein n=1 Tax=Pseudomonas abietaniphila TaxID=89065 RepID=UPI0032175A1C
MENYKFLYELSKKALDEELDRYKKLDEKASRFLSILSIGIVAYTALINAASSKLREMSSLGFTGWAFLTLTGLTFIALFSVWFRIFNSIKLSDSPTVAIGKTVNVLAEEEELITMYSLLAESCQDALQLARPVLKAKTDYLESAYREIFCSTCLLGMSLVLYFWIAAFPNGVGI